MFALRLQSDELWMRTILHMLARVLLCTVVVLVACGGYTHRGGGGCGFGGGVGRCVVVVGLVSVLEVCGGGDGRSDVNFSF